MLTAHLDETGQQGRGLVIVGGFIGTDEQWDDLAHEWPKGFEGSQRKSLHLRQISFKRDSDKALLDKLGPIPQACGLKRISGSVNVADYFDLVEGTVAELHAHGYALAVLPLILAIEATIPNDEVYRLVFEEQTSLGFYRNKILDLIAYTLSHPPKEERHAKRPRLIEWRTAAKDATQLCEPSDYLCYHLAHNSFDPSSRRSVWTKPIMGDGTITIRHLTREASRNLFANTPSLSQQGRDDLASFKKYIRSGQYDPWRELLSEKESKFRQ